MQFALVVTICIAATSGKEGWVISTSAVVYMGILVRKDDNDDDDDEKVWRMKGWDE